MAGHKFCNFLLAKGIVKEDLIYAALNIQKEKTRPIGQIALKERRLSVKEVFRILDAQVDDNRFFGEIAVDFGYMSLADVNDLLFIQTNEKPSIGEILLEMGKIDEITLDRIMTEFEKET